jgi:hypothetical protein
VWPKLFQEPLSGKEKSMPAALTSSLLLETLTETVAAHHGTVIDAFDDGRRLFARSVLPEVKEVRPGDGFQGGVALRSTGNSVWVHPYVFRLVCKNGAIMAQSLQTLELQDMELLSADMALLQVREAIEICCSREAFTPSVEALRASRDRNADLAIGMMANLRRMTAKFPDSSNFTKRILDQFFEERDRSHYGLINAITAVARETREPERRWELESFAGSLALLKMPLGEKTMPQRVREQRQAKLAVR